MKKTIGIISITILVLSIYFFTLVYASSPESIIDELKQGTSKVYSLGGKEYIVSYSYCSGSDQAVFSVNGEGTTDLKSSHYDYLLPGQKYLFSDGSSLFFLSGRYEKIDYTPYCFAQFKLQASETQDMLSCTAGWTCEDSFNKVYVASNCFKSNKEVCPFGCSNGQCLQETCSVGWKCHGNYNRGYQNSDCTISNLEYCSLGCTNGQCIPEQVLVSDNQESANSVQNSDSQQQNRRVCQAGWICTDSATRAYRSQYCEISSETLCPNGCNNGNCIARQNLGVAVTDTTGKIRCRTFCWIGRMFTSWFTG